MKKLKNYLILTFLLVGFSSLPAQDTAKYKLLLDLPLIDLPQNINLTYHSPSMNQSFHVSNDLYELSFWGIDELGDLIFKSKENKVSPWKKYANPTFAYLLSLGFSKYGSELPIPLGVWGHEEFHRSVLGLNDLNPKNGNWIFNRWDGTVYGLTDESLDELKGEKPDQLLYSFVAGIHYEILLNEKTTLQSFYKQRNMTRAALLLYNAWYTYDYFRFSTSDLSDSVKVLAPPHESINPAERDFAGADLTSWIYDMFNPTVPFTARDNFPGGNGVNRRVGFSDLSDDARDYLIKQKNLSLINFINPGIFFIDRITVTKQFRLTFFTQYAPTHFGNSIFLFVPVTYGKYDLLIKAGKYNNRDISGSGFGVGIFNLNLGRKAEVDAELTIWNQPRSFADMDKFWGGSAELSTSYNLTGSMFCYLSLHSKTSGWELGNPYLDDNLSLSAGISYRLASKN
jgi:hypothetical protein